MRILDNDRDQKLDNVTLLLKEDEASQLISYLKFLLNEPINNHSHLSSNDFKKELTVAIYGDGVVWSGFSERFIRLIKDDI